ncbi:MAG: sodium ion-translocating decarboxylase subunit beta, partial [Christensenellaceae bacterium]|nr:sodium ion-translocating decarboxylase subunit beta [Christensenellaceae bacterium]
MDILGTLKGLAEDSGFGLFFAENGWKYLVMLLISFVLLYLGIKKKFEPLLLVGIAFGCLLTNLPGAGLYTPELWDVYAGTEGAQFVTASGDVLTHVTFTDIIHYGGLLDILYIGVKSGLYPCLIFIGIGAMTDFGPLIANPKTFILGAAAQFGVFFAFFGATLLGFNGNEAASIGIIGGADGPTAILTTSLLAPHLLGPIAIAAYSYMALIPMIQPPIMKLLTTPEERKIKMFQLREVSKTEKIVFPIVVAVFVILLLPSTAPLIGCLMFGNLLKETGVCERLSDTAQNGLMNIVT